VLKATENMVICANDRTEVTESDGSSWQTREPAICYFDANKWFNVIGMIRSNGIHYYCNISSPFAYDTEALKYIDYDLDIRIYPDMTYDLLDIDEYKEHKKLMHYPEELEHILYNNVQDLINWIHQGKGPFEAGFVDRWYEIYLTYR